MTIWHVLVTEDEAGEKEISHDKFESIIDAKAKAFDVISSRGNAKLSYKGYKMYEVFEVEVSLEEKFLVFIMGDDWN